MPHDPSNDIAPATGSPRHPQQDLARQVRRTVGVAALRRIHRLLARWREEERRDRRVSLIALALLLGLLAAAALWYLGAGDVTRLVPGG